MDARACATTALAVMAIAGGCRAVLGIDDPIVSATDSGARDSGSACLIASAFTSPQLGIPSVKHVGAQFTEMIGFGGTLTADFEPDVFSLDLYANRGAYTNMTLEPATITVSGAELSMATCGACLYLGADYHLDPMATPVATQTYWAVSGTVEIDEVVPMLTGRVLDAVYQHQDFDVGGKGTPSPDGCETRIDVVTFAIAVGSAM